MFGNQLGWIISFCVAVAGTFLGFQLLLLAQPTSPTGWVQKTVQPLQLADLAKGVLDPMTDLKDDAGDLYRHAISDYQRHKTAYQELQKTRDFDESDIAELAGMDDLVKAAACPAMDLFRSKPDEIVGYSTSVDSLDDLEEIKKAVENVIALAMYDKRYDVAHKYANALMALGYHLYVERVAYIELSAAENFMGTGCAALLQTAKAEHADAKISALQNFDQARKDEFANKIEPVYQIISGEGQQDIGEHAGDMFELAGDEDVDRVWRVEAIRKIGRLQRNAEKQADQTKAPKFLDKLAADTKQDPVIRATAIKARNITAYDYQSQR
jgi:hypothetical protein